MAKKLSSGLGSRAGGHLDDAPGAELRRQLRVDGVVGVDRRLRGRSSRGTRSRSCARPRACRRARSPAASRRRSSRARSPARARREHERLEGRAGLPLALDREVELALRGSSCRRSSRAPGRTRVDGDERRRGPSCWSATCRSPRAPASAAEVDRRVHLEAAAEDLARAVVGDQLLLHVLGEVLRRAARTRQAYVVGARAAAPRAPRRTAPS